MKIFGTKKVELRSTKSMELKCTENLSIDKVLKKETILECVAKAWEQLTMS
jgi:hypothetical protein